MDNKGVILFVEDDHDDVEILTQVFEDIGNTHELINYATLDEAFEYLKTHSEKPFLIICDNDFRNKNKNKLRNLIHTYPEFKTKGVPFVFFSSVLDNELVQEAYADLNVQGFFQKRTSFDKIRHDVAIIIEYWETSLQPAI